MAARKTGLVLAVDKKNTPKPGDFSLGVARGCEHLCGLVLLDELGVLSALASTQPSDVRFLILGAKRGRCAYFYSTLETGTLSLSKQGRDAGHFCLVEKGDPLLVFGQG